MSNISTIQKRPESRPLIDALHALAQGDYSVRLPVAGSAEQRQLAQAFNAAAEQSERRGPARRSDDEDASGLALRSEQLLAQSQTLVHALKAQQAELARLTERIVQQLVEGAQPLLRTRSRHRPAPVAMDPGAALFAPPGDEAPAPRAPGQRLILTLAGQPGRQDAFAHCGFASVAASDGPGLLNLARQLLPDVVLVDASSVGLQPAAVASLLSQNPRTWHIPLMAEWSVAERAVCLQVHRWLDASMRMPQPWWQEGGSIPRRVMIVHAEEAQRRTLAGRWLASGAGIEVVSAADGQDALALLRQGAADAVIVASELAGEEPFEWLARLAHAPDMLPADGLPLLLCTTASTGRLARLQAVAAEDKDALLIRFLQRLGAGAADREPCAVLPQTAGRKVLVVDGDVRNCYLLADLLQAAGIHVLVADCGKEGLEVLLAHNDTDLVLMDVASPLGEGEDTIRIMRGLDEFRHLPIIALGAALDRHGYLLDAGASDCLECPANAEHLNALLQVWLA